MDDIDDYIKKCPTAGCETPMVLINIMRLVYPNGQSKVQTVHYCHEHGVSLRGDLIMKILEH